MYNSCSRFCSNMDKNLILQKIINYCPCRASIANQIVDAIFNQNMKRILIVGATGSGKTRFAKKLISLLDENYHEITSAIGYSQRERQSLYELGQQPLF